MYVHNLLSFGIMQIGNRKIMVTTSRTAYRQLLPGVTVGIFVILGLILLSGIENVGSQLLRYQWQFFGYSVCVSFFNYIIRFFKRQYYYNRTGIKKLFIGKSLLLFLASFPLTATSINVGESYKGLWLNKVYGIPVERGISIHIIDFIFDGLSVFLLSLFGTIAFPALWPFFLIVLVLFMVAVIVFQVKPAIQGLLDISEKVPLIQKMVPILRKCVDCNPDLFQFGPMSVAFLLGFSSWLAEGTALYFILLGFGLHASWPLFGIAIFIFSFALLAGFITNLPGGLGVVELSMTLFLATLLGFKPYMAVTATLLFRLAAFWLSFIIGLVFWKVTGKSLGIQHDEGRIIES